MIARFKELMGSVFGSVRKTVAALAKDGQKIGLQEFIDGLARHGFQHPAKQLFHGLDRDGRKHVGERDLLFIERWKSLDYLLAEPDLEAMWQFVDQCQARYG